MSAAGKLGSHLLVLAAAIMIVGAPSASAGVAASRYVDAQTGSDAAAICSLAAPCLTIAHAIASAGSGEVIHVDNGSYPEQVTLGNGKSLAFENFVTADGTGPAIVDGGAGTAVTVAATGAGHIRGLTIRGNASGVLLQGTPTEVDHNTFDDPDGVNSFGIDTGSSIDVGSIHDNTFTDPAPSTTRGRAGIVLNYTTGSVLDNDVSGMMRGINVAAPVSGNLLIAGNEITGTHDLPSAGDGIAMGGGGGSGTVVVRANRISGGTGATVTGIELFVGATLIRNQIDGMVTGVHVGADTPGVTLEGDRIWNNTNADLQLNDPIAAAPRTSVTATNVTLLQGSVAVDSSDLVLDSSIIEGIGAGGNATCTITFSRADTSGSAPNGCDNFSTTAAPLLVNTAGGDLHLTPSSLMIDAGNPAAPVGGAVDFDGDPRAVDATPACSGNVAVRDIGADEFVPVTPDCEPPETTLTKTPPKKTTKRRVTFEFESSEPLGGEFRCKLDGDAYAFCDSPFKVKVGVGRHTFRVVASDAVDNEDASPAKATFRRIRG